MLLLIAFVVALLALACACWEIRNLRGERDAWRVRCAKALVQIKKERSPREEWKPDYEEYGVPEPYPEGDRRQPRTEQ